MSKIAEPDQNRNKFKQGINTGWRWSRLRSEGARRRAILLLCALTYPDGELGKNLRKHIKVLVSFMIDNALIQC